MNGSRQWCVSIGQSFNSVYRKTVSILLAVFLLLEPLTPLFAAEEVPQTTDAPATTSAPVDTTPVITVPRGTEPPPETNTSQTEDGVEFSVDGKTPEIKPPPKVEQPSEDTKKLEEVEPETESLMGMGGATQGSDRGQVRLSSKINEQDGAFTYDYPLMVPPGRNGREPSLVLSYNSRGGGDDDIFGYGWSINIPFIERVNKVGSEQIFTQSVFYSSLGGELVQIGSTTQYRPKVETGEFLKYVFANDLWKITDKSGTVYTFGSTTSSREDNAASSTQIAKWMLDEVRDTNDNYVKYTYYKADNRAYPATIVYTGSGATDGPFSISFVRSTTTSNSPRYESGFAATTTYRISEINTAVSGSWVRKYALAYGVGDNSVRTLLSGITESARTEGSTASTTMPATTFTYENTMSQTWTASSWALPEPFTQNGIDMGTRDVDINGDGFPDIIRFYRDATGTTIKRVYLNNKVDGWTLQSSWDWTYFTVPFSEYYAVGDSNARNDNGVRFADVNGDALTDVLIGYDGNGSSDTQKIYINYGAGWSYDSSWVLPVYFTRYYSSRVWDNGVRIADINGDGLPDLVSAQWNASSTLSTVFLNTGSGWSTTTSWVMPRAFTGAYDGVHQGKDLGTQLVDVNGDGLTDVVHGLKSTIFGNSKNTYLNTGSGWATSTLWDLPDYLIWADEAVSDIGYRFEDVNGDGLVDLSINNTFGGSIPDDDIYINTGAGWTNSIGNFPPYQFVTSTGDTGARFMDVNADRLPDEVYGNTSSSTGPVSSEETYLNRREVGDLLINVTEPKGGTLAITYQSSHEYRSAGSSTNPSLPFPITTVATTTKDAGFGTTETQAYLYEGGDYWFDATLFRDRKFAGFSTMTKTGPTQKERIYFHQGNETNVTSGEYADDSTKIGFPYRSEVADLANRPYKVSTSEWVTSDLGSSASFVKETQTIDLAYDGDSDYKARAVTYVYDDTNGLLTTKTEWGEVTPTTTNSQVVSTSSASIDLESGSSQLLGITDAAQSTLDILGSMTIEAWVRPESQPSVGGISVIASKWSASADQSYALYYENDAGTKKLVFRMDDTTTNPSKICSLSTTLSDATWYHVAVAYDAANASSTLYVNGSSIGYCTGLYTSILNSTTDFRVGAWQNTATHFFDGLIDELRVWSGVRTQAQIQASKDAELAGNESGLQAYWRLNNSSLDTTTNDNDLTLYGGPVYSTSTPLASVYTTAASRFTFTDAGVDKRTTQYTYASNTAAYVTLLQKETLLDRASSTIRENRFYYDTQALGTVTDGNMTKAERLVSGSSTYIDEEWTYNSYGLVSQSKDPRDKATTYVYDSYNLYPATTTNPVSHVLLKSYDYSSGKVATTTDPNSRVFVTVYDAFDRPIEEQIPDPVSGSPVTKATYSYIDTAGSNRIATTQNLNNSTSTESYDYFDGFGRKIQSRVESEASNTFAVRDFYYNSNGLLDRESLPYFNNGSSRTSSTTDAELYSIYTYDPLGRIATTTTAVGTTATVFDDWTERVVDALGNPKGFAYDAYGRLATTTEYNASTTYATAYLWDMTDKLATITDALGNIRAITYDKLGRRLTLQDLHASADTTFGTSSFAYDASGNLGTTTDPKGQTVVRTYDDVNRILTENYTGLAGTEISYTYDTCTNGKGKLCQAIRASSATTTYAYTPPGLLDIATTTVGTSTYTANYDYDRQGNQTQLTYPDASVASYTYNTGGQLEKVQYKESGGSYSDVVSDFNYGPHGMITYELYGNGVSTTKVYDEDQLYRLKTIITVTATGTVGYGGGGDELRELETSLTLGTDGTLLFAVEEEIGAIPEEEAILEEETATQEEVPDITPPLDTEDVGETLEEESPIGTSTDDGAVAATSSTPETAFSSTTEEVASSTPEDTFLESTSTIDMLLVGTTTATTTDLATSTTPILTGIMALIEGKTYEEIARIKSEEIAKIDMRGLYTKGDLDIEILDVAQIDGGIQVFARAWESGVPLGFGTEGTVEIERFRIFNPPILVPDKEGLVVRTSVNLDGETKVHTYREDPLGAVRTVIQDSIERVGKRGTLVEVSTVGNTTSIFYPASGATSPVDGLARHYQATSDWNTARDATDGTAASATTGDDLAAASRKDSSDLYGIYRGFFLFDTAPITSGNEVTAATLSLYTNAVSNADNDGDDFISIVSTSTPASDANITTADYDQCGATEAHDTSERKDLTGMSVSVYKDWSMNATGRSSINVTGISKFCAREGHDLLDTPYAGGPNTSNYFNILWADTAGTTQDPTLTVTHTPLPSPTGGNTIQYRSYTYDAVGNITQIVESGNTLARATTTYTYDPLYRLVSASTTQASSTPYSETYAYNAIGNLTYKSNVGTYSYGGSSGSSYANPHAPTSINGVTYAYDKNGNLASTTDSKTYTWDYANRLSSTVIGSLTTTYQYNHEGQRVYKTNASGTIASPYTFYETDSGTTTKHIYTPSGDLLSTIDKRGSTTTRSYAHTDHLGSTVAITSNTGAVSQVLEYYPYGGTRIDQKYGATNQRNRYIGQDSDIENSLIYLNARYYDGQRGQFLSQDPVFNEVGLTKDGKAVMRNPQAMNSYSYAQNNPVVYKDPSGRIAFVPLVLGIVMAYGYVQTAVDVYHFTNVLRYPEAFTTSEMNEAGVKVIHDAAGIGAGRLLGPDVGSGIDTFGAIYDTVNYGVKKIDDLFKKVKNLSVDGGQNIHQTTPAIGNIPKPQDNKTYISAPPSTTQPIPTAQNSSNYNSATSYLNSAQRALNRGDLKSAERFIGKARRSLGN